MSSARIWLVVGLALAVAAVALAVGVLHFPDWIHDKQSDYDQAAVLEIGSIVLAVVGYAWFAWRNRRSG